MRVLFTWMLLSIAEIFVALNLGLITRWFFTTRKSSLVPLIGGTTGCIGLANRSVEPSGALVLGPVDIRSRNRSYAQHRGVPPL